MISGRIFLHVFNTEYKIGVNNMINEIKIPQMTLTGDTSGMSHDVSKVLAFTFELNGRTIEGYAKTKWQGDSSTGLIKKNYKFKAYTDVDCKQKLSFKVRPDWTTNNTFNLKANFIDVTHARNIINAKLFSEMAATRPNVNAELVSATNFSEIQGFPIKLKINDNDAGVYTFNTGKDDVLFNMNKGSNLQGAVEAAQWVDETRFLKDEAKFDGSDFTVEYPDEITPTLKNSFESLMKWAHQSNIYDIQNQQKNYIDVDSVIDFGLFSNVIQDTDMNVKNAMYVTYDAKKWMMVPYDLDTSWQLQWDGKSLQNINQNLFDFQSNRLLQMIFAANPEKVLERYHFLRQTTLREDHIIELFRNFMFSVGEENYETDLKLWPSIPSAALTDFTQLQSAIYHRLKVVDQQVEEKFAGGEVGAIPNYVKNSDFMYDTSDWDVFGSFHRTLWPSSIGHGSAGASYDDQSLTEVTWPSIQSKPIWLTTAAPNNPEISFAGNIYIYSGEKLVPGRDSFNVSVRFLDTNLKEIGYSAVWADINVLDQLQRLKAEHVSIPEGTAYVRFAYFAGCDGHAIMTQPQINFSPTLGKYTSN